MPSIPFVTAIEGISSDLVTGRLVDLTTYTSPARDTLALYAYLSKRDVASVDTPITISNANPTAVTYWEFDLAASDGWYVAIVFGFPIWQAGTYALNKCVYNDGVYYRANQSTIEEPGTGSQWDVITDILSEVLNLADTGVYITQTNNFSSARSEAGKLGDDLAALGQKIINGKCKNWEDAASVLFPAGLVESAWVNFRRGDNVNAQEIIDYVQERFAA
jgi:hypothetical protein